MPTVQVLKTVLLTALVADAEACSKAGVELRKKGGSAVDLAIAAHLCVHGGVNFYSAGI